MSDNGIIPRLDEKKLKEFQKWKKECNNPSLRLFDYFDNETSLDKAIAYAKLFWPDFVEVDGFIFLKRNYNHENYLMWKKKLNNNKKEVENMINHVHLSDLFLNSTNGEEEEEVWEYLGRVIIKSWETALKETFPKKKFVCEYNGSGSGAILVFYQEE